MKRFIAGGVIAIALASGGLLFWQSRASSVIAIPKPPPPAPPEDGLPLPEDGAPLYGARPPMPLTAPKASREQVRFNRYDRNRDNIITRIEMLSSRTKAFKELDKDGNNLLTFEEWAVATSDRFSKADGDRNGLLTRLEFATTKPKEHAKVKCKC